MIPLNIINQLIFVAKEYVTSFYEVSTTFSIVI